uniref:Uncharacterized protein n=1 Tax=Anguilla anguilla TaxID=7936 RepID=A0A0E9WG50_ANGAN
MNLHFFIFGFFIECVSECVSGGMGLFLRNTFYGIIVSVPWRVCLGAVQYSTFWIFSFYFLLPV